MDNPIAAKQIETVVFNAVVPMCRYICEETKLDQEVSSLTSELERKKKERQAAIHETVENFDAFMELLELSPLYARLKEHTKYQRLSIQSFSSILNVSRDVTKTVEFQKRFRMVGDRVNPSNVDKVYKED